MDLPHDNPTIDLGRTMGSAGPGLPDAPGIRTGNCGPYRLLRFLGAGGMGEVYCAEQQAPRRQVALKLLRQGTRCAAVLRRFDREAEVLARLQHPSIVRVLDAGTIPTATGEEPFLAMDYVDGAPLLVAVEKLQLDQNARIRLLIDTCDALEHAHQRGVIHRDLKPENVLIEVVEGAPRPRLLDFGIALSATDHRGDDPDPKVLAGTLDCMSPEQASGDVGVRADVYSLGALGYRLLTGRPPLSFHGLDLFAAIDHLAHAVPPPASTYCARLRGDLDAILAKALCKDPAQRYPSAAALAEDLRRHLQRRFVHARRYSIAERCLRTLQRHRAAAALFGLLGALAAGAGIAVTSANLRAAASDGERAELLTTLTDRICPLLEEFGGTQPVRQQLLDEMEPRIAVLLANAPADPTALRLRASLLTLRANMHRDACEVEDGRHCRDQALAALTALWNRTPGDLALRRQLANALVCRSDIDKDAGDAAAALPGYEVAHAHFVALQRARPDTRQPNDDLGWSFLRIGDVRLHLDDLEQAGALLQACREQAEFLESHFGDYPSSLSLAQQLNNVAASYERKRQRPGRAEEHDRLALVLAERLRAMAPQHLGYLMALVTTYSTHAHQALRCGQMTLARELLDRGVPHAAELATVAAGNRFACHAHVQFSAQQIQFEARVGNWPAVFAAATRTYELLASIATIDEASPGNRCLRDGAALGAVYALCGLDLVDACAAEPLLARIRAQRACTDRTRWERVAALLVQAQCTDECTPPATIAECQDAAANESGEFAQLAGAIAGRRLGDLQPLHALLGSLPDGDDAQLQLIESRARRELARR